RLAGGYKVNLFEAPLVVFPAKLQERRREWQALLSPKRIGDVQLVRAVAVGLQLRSQVGEGGMQPLLFKVEVQRLRYLRGGFTARPAIGHAQGGRDAV